MSTPTQTQRDGPSFAETALRLGGKSDDEARRLGAVDRADEQVESLFSPQYQTVNSPVHKAVWDGRAPLELFAAPPLPPSAPGDEAMERSLSVVRERKERGQLLDEKGKVYELLTRGWLPYLLRWHFRRTEKVPFERMALTAWGDFVGEGRWTFRPDGAFVDVTYEWTVLAEKPLLRYFSWLFRPIFAANHRWAMACGEESVRLELARRRAASAEERERVRSHR